VGINSQILSPSGGNIGIGFAIPSNMAKMVMDQLVKTGKVRRGMMGVTIQPVDADLAASLGLPTSRGAIVTSVAAAGPAEKAGIKRGDVITAINNQPVIDSNSLRNLVAAIPPGTTVNVAANREGTQQNFQVALAELPSRARAQEDEDTDGGTAAGGEKFGLSLQILTPDAARRHGLSAEDEGLLVARVNPSGAAANAGIRQGDLIIEVNRRQVRSVPEFTAAIQQSGARPALILIKRRDSVQYLTLRPSS
jgi:S1-C subfamily serine protease